MLVEVEAESSRNRCHGSLSHLLMQFPSAFQQTCSGFYILFPYFYFLFVDILCGYIHYICVCIYIYIYIYIHLYVYIYSFILFSYLNIRLLSIPNSII